MKTENLFRARFYIDFEDCDEDYRPISWPIKYPYWVSGENEESFIIVTYCENKNEIIELWPEAHDIELEKVDNVEFSGRFPKPEWYKK